MIAFNEPSGTVKDQKLRKYFLVKTCVEPNQYETPWKESLSVLSRQTLLSHSSKNPVAGYNHLGFGLRPNKTHKYWNWGKNIQLLLAITEYHNIVPIPNVVRHRMILRIKRWVHSFPISIEKRKNNKNKSVCLHISDVAESIYCGSSNCCCLYFFCIYLAEWYECSPHWFQYWVGYLAEGIVIKAHKYIVTGWCLLSARSLTLCKTLLLFILFSAEIFPSQKLCLFVLFLRIFFFILSTDRKLFVKKVCEQSICFSCVFLFNSTIVCQRIFFTSCIE